MGAIAERAGVTRQLLYVHFAGRADLFLELSRVVDADARPPELQASIDDAPDGRAAVAAAVAVQGSIKPAIDAVAHAVDRLRWTDPDAAHAWEERERARLERCVAVMERCADEGVLDPTWTIDGAARLLWSTTSQRAWRELTVEGDWTTAQWVERTTRLLGDSLLAD